MSRTSPSRTRRRPCGTRVEAVVEHVHRARGGALRLRDDIALRVLDEEGEPVRDLPHEVRVAVGEVHGLQTDRGGAAGISDVQPGRYRVALPLSRRAGRGPNSDGMGEPPGEVDRFDIALYRRTSVIHVPRLDGRAHPAPDATIAFRLWSDSRDFEKVDSVTFEVRSGGSLLWSETHASNYVRPGRYEWRWNGVDAVGIYDTERLRNGIRMTVTAALGGRTASRSVELRGAPLFFGEGMLTAFDWLNTRVDTSARTAEVTLYVDCRNGGYIDDVSQDGASIPYLATGELPATTFRRLVQLVTRGIETYWSRTGARSAHGYSVGVRAVRGRGPRRPPHAINVYVNRNANPARSGNLPGLTPFTIYNQTFYAARGGTAVADPAFKMMAAHEFAHSIVAATQGRRESYSHHGTTGVITQRANNSATPYPTSGEIDLMKYYDDPTPPPRTNIYRRTVASERDVTRLVEGLSIRLVPV